MVVMMRWQTGICIRKQITDMQKHIRHAYKKQYINMHTNTKLTYEWENQKNRKKHAYEKKTHLHTKKTTKKNNAYSHRHANASTHKLAGRIP